MENALQFVELLLGLVPVVAGGSVAIAVIVDALKKIGLLPDGRAPIVSLVLNFALYVALYFLGDQYGADIQSVLDNIVIVAPVIVSILLTLLGSSKVHDLLVGIGLGFSYSPPANRG